jgi:hypothetical protein
MGFGVHCSPNSPSVNSKQPQGPDSEPGEEHADIEEGKCRITATNRWAFKAIKTYGSQADELHRLRAEADEQVVDLITGYELFQACGGECWQEHWSGRKRVLSARGGPR